MSTYYEAKIIDGQYQVRQRPNGYWTIVYNKVADIANMMETLTEEERLEVMSCFCSYCGITQTPGRSCQCWNDE
jgi:GH24 family phage-related lysozyme (muramidase)